MNLRQALGAGLAATAQKFSIYLPDHDAAGAKITDHDDWIDVAIDLLTRINGGATCMPPSYGTWKGSSRKIVRENTRIVYSFITNAAQFERNIPVIRTFLHSFGRECSQDAVMVEFSGEDKATFVHRAYFIEEYPDAQPLHGIPSIA